jgi:hypothetical protein
MKSLFRTGFQVDTFRPLNRRLGQIITSLDQETAQPVPGIVTTLNPSPSQVPATQPSGTSDSDWAKTIAAALKAASEGYSAATKEDIARLNRQAADLKAKNPTVAPILTQTPAPSSSVLPLVLLGMGVLGALGLFMVLKK